MPRTLWFAVLILCLPYYSQASVFINEVLFDPEGSDTGLEWVELYNDGSHSVDLSGWQLYPDGIGYYTFGSGAAIGGGQYLVINLRTSGTDSTSVLYHSSATGNAGNSSGSFALFSGEPRGKDTIKSFVRYHKPGSTEKKTWESSAAEAGIWTAGNYVDISSFSEGKSISYLESAWGSGAPTKGSGALGSAAGATAADSEAASTTSSFSVPQFIQVPRLQLDVAVHPNAVAGASHRFQARAFAENGKLVDSKYIRFLWNFGDGTVSEGPALTHTYRFPGIYSISVNANTDAALGTFYTDLSVGENSLEVLEVKPGEEGYVKIFNDSSVPLDLTGWIVADGKGNSFTIPLDTKVKSERALILPNETTGLDPESSSLKVYYPNMRLAAAQTASSPSEAPRPILALAEETGLSKAVPLPRVEPADLAVTEDIEPILVETAALTEVPSSWTFFFGVFGLGIVGGAAIIWAKRTVVL